MSLEHYKTQVLLLHSRQSTLDSLSTGFSDRYTVHCATSGTEALNTLVETPIHVIVSAQDLPGMSGLDALREAKKRSPDTIGILLAGTDQRDGLEALVGDKEVFQIVRGEIEPKALRELIEDATKRVRLMALSESANDLAANVDEPVSEHIVMETSENGSAIISDGTGTMPALKPQKIQVSAEVGGRAVDVLVLTKDEEFLVTIKDSSRGLHHVHHAHTPSQAEEIARNHKVGVLVTDAAMVGSNIEALSQRLRAEVPRLVAVVAGRRDDGEMLMDLINRGQVYRFLLKPVSPGRGRLAIEASVKHHLEAADSAFKPAPKKSPPPRAAARMAPRSAPKAPPRPAPKAVPKAAPKATPKPAAKPAPKLQAAPKPKPKAAAKPQSRARSQAKAAAVTPRKAPTISAMPLDDGLDDPFSDGGFAETMTGIATSVGKSIFGATDALKSDSKSAAAAPQPGVAGSSKSFFRNRKLLAAIAGFVVLAAGAAWLYTLGSGSTPDDSAETIAGPAAATPAVVESEVMLPGSQRPAYEDLLEEARLARDADQLIAPRGGSAVELYVAARAAAPDNVTIAAEFDELIDRVLGLAETALLEQRSGDAAAAIAMARFASPDNPRLTFLEAQLAQMQLRQALDQVRADIRENHFEDAALALRRAESFAGDETSEIDLLAEELAAARSEQRVEDVLALAVQRLDENLLTTPSNDNARYYYELALSNDPQNTAARQGLAIVAGKLVLGAREAIDNGNFSIAEGLLTDARALDPGSEEVAASSRALAGAREAQAVAAREAQAKREAELERRAAAEREQQRLAAEREAEVQRQTAAREAALREEAEQEATRRAAALSAAAALAAGTSASAGAEPGSAESVSANRVTAGSDTAAAAAPANALSGNDAAATTSAVAEPGASATVRGSSNAADTTLLAAAAAARTTLDLDAGMSPTAAATATTNPASAAPTAAAAPLAVGISGLTRINYASPKYPRNAMRRNITGSVDVSFTVGHDGHVYDIEIIDSTPGSVFDQAAIDAVQQWQFEPVIEAGQTVERRSAVRMAFDLQ